MFNLAHGLDQMLWRRPQNRFEELDRLYLVGGGTHPGSGLPTILESGRISAKMICADLVVDPEWNGADPWFADYYCRVTEMLFERFDNNLRPNFKERRN